MSENLDLVRWIYADWEGGDFTHGEWDTVREDTIIAFEYFWDHAEALKAKVEQLRSEKRRSVASSAALVQVAEYVFAGTE